MRSRSSPKPPSLADAAATLIANAVDLPGHPAIQRIPACDRAPTTISATASSPSTWERSRKTKSRRRSPAARAKPKVPRRRTDRGGGTGLQGRTRLVGAGASLYKSERRRAPTLWRSNMPSVEVRKRVIIVEEIFHEGGPVATKPYRRGAILAVIKNPFAGRYVEDIVGFSDDLKPLGLEMAEALIAALGGKRKHRRLWQGRDRRLGGRSRARRAVARPRRLRDARGARRRAGDRALGEKSGWRRRTARRADHPQGRVLRAQPF